MEKQEQGTAGTGGRVEVSSDATLLRSSADQNTTIFPNKIKRSDAFGPSEKTSDVLTYVMSLFSRSVGWGARGGRNTTRQSSASQQRAPMAAFVSVSPARTRHMLVSDKRPCNDLNGESDFVHLATLISPLKHGTDMSENVSQRVRHLGSVSVKI